MTSKIVNNGKNLMLHRLFTAAPTQTAPTVFKIGTGTVDVQVTDTALGTMITAWNTGTDTKTFESGYPDFDTTNKEVEVRGRVTSAHANGYSISEAGTFNLDGTNVMHDRTVFTAISKTSLDDVIIIWKFRVI